MKKKTHKFYIRTCSSIEQKGVLITVFINTFFSLSRVDVTKTVEVYSKNNFCFWEYGQNMFAQFK